MALGFRPSEDPDWRHAHVPTGEVRQCSREGCTAVWAVLCHSGHKRYCDRCSHAVRRVKDREAKAAKRFMQRWRNTDREEAVAMMALDYARTGEIEPRSNDDDYSTTEWACMVAEAIEQGNVLMLENDAEDEAEERQSRLAEQARLLDLAQAAAAARDLQAERIIRERLTALTTRRLSA